MCMAPSVQAVRAPRTRGAFIGPACDLHGRSVTTNGLP